LAPSSKPAAHRCAPADTRHTLALSRARARLLVPRPADAWGTSVVEVRAERAPNPHDRALEPPRSAEPRLHGGNEPDVDLRRLARGLGRRARARVAGDGLRRRV